MNQLDLINRGFEKGLLLNKELCNSASYEPILEMLDHPETPHSLLVLNFDLFSYKSPSFDFLEFDRLRTNLEKKQEILPYSLFLDNFKKKSSLPQPTSLLSETNLKILVSHQNQPKKYEVSDFTKIFVSRYRFLEGILRNRQELANILSINKVINKKDKETLSLIGLISEINLTKTGNLVFTLEDLTGKIEVMVSKNNPSLYLSAKELVLDEVVGIVGSSRGLSFFAESIIWPDLPLNNEMKKNQENLYFVFISDLHVGSAGFLEKEFNKFLSWLKGELGNETQKEIAQSIKYLFIAGDLVDGVGVYPNQDKELLIKDIYQQYQAVADLLKKVPPHIQIIVCPGNHDALYLAEPQPAFNLKYVAPLRQLPNLILVSNPSLINIAQTNGFSGFDLLLYHGYSFDYYVANVDSLRSAGGYSRADLIMRFLLKKRHLAPSFTSTPYYPSSEDPLLIKKIPDFFLSGHIHYSIAANYRNVTLISGSCWQSKTSFQEKLGHEPQPARVSVINLKTREVKILKFN